MMTTRSEEPNEFLFMPIISGLLLIVGAAALVWLTQIRPASQAAEPPVDEAVSTQLTHQTAAETEGQAEAAQPLLGDPANGQQQFTMTCSACHGPAGEGIAGLGKDLTTSEFVSGQADAELIDFIKVGRDPSDPLNTTGIGMPPKGGNPALTDEDLQDIVSFMRTIEK
jgi:disulfide bond formation protein DsbB